MKTPKITDKVILATAERLYALSGGIDSVPILDITKALRRDGYDVDTDYVGVSKRVRQVLLEKGWSINRFVPA